MKLSLFSRTFRVIATTTLLLVIGFHPGLAQDDRTGPPPQAQTAPAENAAAEPQPVVLALDGAVELHANGDASARIVLDFTDEQFERARQTLPDARVFIRDMRPGRADWELAPDATCAYDEATTSLVMNVRELGALKNEGDGRWVLKLDPGMRFSGLSAAPDGRIVARFEMSNTTPDGVEIAGNVVYTLPEGASDAAHDAADQEFSYHLEYQGPRGPGRLDVRFDARDKLMSALYKVYGLKTAFAAQWVAKTVVRNTGAGPLANLRIRYRVEGYSEWSLWDKFPEILPGQTVVSSYHPVLSREIARLHSTTPANVHVEWRYEDAAGNVREDSDGERISILGIHEFIFSNLTEEESTGAWYDMNSNSPFLAAWVSRDDPVVARFAAMANKVAGGEGAPYSDEAAWKVLAACYELMLANDFTYQGPKSVTDDTSNFDAKTVQSIKFPRDVIRDRSGTCVELTGLYASMVHAVGLKPFIVLVPGHAFPAIVLPSGKLAAVETTGVGGGLQYGAAPFKKVVESAYGSLDKAFEDGRIIMVDVELLWTRGISDPELAELPANILDEWGIKAVGMKEKQEVIIDGADQLAGRWNGTATGYLPDGSSIEYPVEMTIQAQGNGAYAAEAVARIPYTNGWGYPCTIVVRESFQGGVVNGQLELRGTSKTASVLETGESQQETPDYLYATLQNGMLSGQVGSDFTGWGTFSMRNSAGGMGYGQWGR